MRKKKRKSRLKKGKWGRFQHTPKVTALSGQLPKTWARGRGCKFFTRPHPNHDSHRAVLSKAEDEQSARQKKENVEDKKKTQASKYVVDSRTQERTGPGFTSTKISYELTFPGSRGVW
ncbi:UNVERIFIED_CONTAM: hypothetical protein Slati_1735200 [Sesamum latifolium]|uniref:Uncharacterized protein n=1 Tax=Sesamum latifolium TaxID=2727402 RepID=A0AAW2WXA2_9LAMI